MPGYLVHVGAVRGPDLVAHEGQESQYEGPVAVAVDAPQVAGIGAEGGPVADVEGQGQAVPLAVPPVMGVKVFRASAHQAAVPVPLADGLAPKRGKLLLDALDAGGPVWSGGLALRGPLRLALLGLCNLGGLVGVKH